MNTEFLMPVDLGKLISKIKEGDQKAEDSLYEELSRLESIIRGYEIAIESVNNRFNSRHYKTPMNKYTNN